MHLLNHRGGCMFRKVFDLESDDITHEKTYHKVKFKGMWVGESFNGVSFTNCEFVDCSFNGDFANCVFDGSSFEDCVFNSEFANCSLDLRRVKNLVTTGSHFYNCLINLRIMQRSLYGATWDRCSFTGVKPMHEDLATHLSMLKKETKEYQPRIGESNNCRAKEARIYRVRKKIKEGKEITRKKTGEKDTATYYQRKVLFKGEAYDISEFR